MVSLQSFEHFDITSMVDKSTDHLKLLSICFLQYHQQLLTSICDDFSCMQQANCATIASFPWSVLLSNIVLDESANEKALSYREIHYFHRRHNYYDSHHQGTHRRHRLHHYINYFTLTLRFNNFTVPKVFWVVKNVSMSKCCIPEHDSMVFYASFRVAKSHFLLK